MTDRRAVSNTLGYVLLFGVVFFSIVAVHTLGVSALTEGRHDTISQNAALSMESMSDAIEDLREENTTARVSTIRGGGGTLSTGSQTTIRVWVGSQTTSNRVYQESFRPIVYQLDNSKIVYEAGALIRTQGSEGAILIDAPEYKVQPEVTILPIINTSSTSGSSISGNTVTVYLEKTKSALRTTSLPSGTVTYQIQTTSQRAQVWQQHLSERIGMTCEPISGGTVTCDNGGDDDDDSDTVIVQDIRITYELVT